MGLLLIPLLIAVLMILVALLFEVPPEPTESVELGILWQALARSGTIVKEVMNVWHPSNGWLCHSVDAACFCSGVCPRGPPT
jgi:hypothetical protein